MAVAAAGPGEGWPGRLAKSHAVTLRWRTSTELAATLAARPAPRTAGSGSVAAYGNRQRRAPWGQQARGQPDLGQPDWGQPDCGQSGRAAGRPEDRKSGAGGKRVSVRGDLGGRRIINKKKIPQSYI